MYPKRATYRIATSLACFALGLIVFASPVNRLLVSFSPGVAGSGCPEPMIGMAPGHDGHPGAPVRLDPCGYCTLLYHSPALAGMVVLSVPPVVAPPFAVALSLATQPLGGQVAARSRGPPFLV